jgi:cbb3-type cytochrome oxidase subunit 3
MFQRLQLPEIQNALAAFALVASFGIFIYFLYRILRMKKSRRDYLSHLPLDDDESESRHTEGNERKD